LLPEIKFMSNDKNSFKSKFTTLLLQNSFYTFEEFFLTEARLEIRVTDRFYNRAMYYDDGCNTIILYVAY
jgi:hypothetical protein